MVRGHMKYRHLSRDSAHRKALLRNLVTSLFEHESISTTWHKAKEAQRLAEKLITLGKRNTEASRRRAHQIFFRPLDMVPKLFGPIRDRYLDRPGGYTRVLRIEPLKEDQAPSAILELVDGARDMRFAITAQTLARDRLLGRAATPLTEMNVAKVLRYRGEAGRAELDGLAEQFARMEAASAAGEEEGGGGGGNKATEAREPAKRAVYTGKFNKPRSFAMYRRKKGSNKDGGGSKVGSGGAVSMRGV